MLVAHVFAKCGEHQTNIIRIKRSIEDNDLLCVIDGCKQASLICGSILLLESFICGSKLLTSLGCGGLLLSVRSLLCGRVLLLLCGSICRFPCSFSRLSKAVLSFGRSLASLRGFAMIYVKS